MVPQFKIELILKMVMYYIIQATCEKIPVAEFSKDVHMISNPANISNTDITFREELSQGIY